MTDYRMLWLFILVTNLNAAIFNALRDGNHWILLLLNAFVSGVAAERLIRGRR